MTEPVTAEPLTVILIPKARRDLRSACEREHLSETDVVNRAVSFYEFASAQRAAGRVLLVRDEKTGVTQRVRIL